MKVLHVSFSDDAGGAAIAAHRLLTAQRSIGLDARMMVITKLTDDPAVHAPLGRTGRARARLARFFAKRIARTFAHEAPEAMRTLAWLSSGIGRAIRRERADVVHLHWLGSEMISLEEIAALPPPVVWTCHDMWPFCGAEHYAEGNRFIEGYPLRGGFDIDRWVFRRKQRAWAGWRPTLVCPSAWIAEQAAASVLTRDAERIVIANTVDTKVFRPIDPSEARDRCGLPREGKLILFGAVGGHTDRRKGFDLLDAAMARLPRSYLDQALFATFGAFSQGKVKIGECRVHEFGEIRDSARLAMLYSAADVFVAPSRMDTSSNTLLEAHACGVPGVAFDVGGMPDIITKPIHGALAPPFDVDALAREIVEVLDRFGPEDRSHLRNDLIARFGPERIARKHLELYQALISGNAGPPITAGGSLLSESAGKSGIEANRQHT